MFKILYDPPLNFRLKSILVVYTAFSTVLWIKTFFLAPRKNYAQLKYVSSFEGSFVGQFFYAEKGSEQTIRQSSTQILNTKTHLVGIITFNISSKWSNKPYVKIFTIRCVD